MSFPAFLSLRSCGRAVKSLLAMAAAGVLVACGGGTSQIEPFIPSRLVAFGDELSALTPDGRKYTVNVLTDGAIDCAAQPIWVQSLASIYSFVFAECNPNNVVDPKALMRAAAGARVADVVAQVDAQLAASGVDDGTLATVLVGGNDILDLYGNFPDVSRATLLSQARERGAGVAAQVNRLVDAGARVIVSTVPDMGLTPFALAEKDANTDIDRAALLSDLSTEFNAGMRTTVLNDGRSVGLVLADEMVQAMKRSPSSFGVANVTDAACTAALPDCTTDTLVDGADASTWLWADTLRLAYNAQSRLSTLAISRARNNPF
ncbi:MAG: esterase [Burkholderiaceae bacterium]|nr:esterase [Rhodoferax sp.]MCP5287332.1 esterase [Burkholderiaceae bacterium]